MSQFRIVIADRTTGGVTGYYCGGNARGNFTTDPARAVVFDAGLEASRKVRALRRQRVRQANQIFTEAVKPRGPK